jgi:hypothetical protein
MKKFYSVFVVLSLMISGASAVQATSTLSDPRAYTALTAPDAISRVVLAKKLTRLDQGVSERGGGRLALHKNFPQLIEQNFAKMGDYRMDRFLKNIGENELSDLAQLYVNAVADSGHQAVLLDIMASRMTPQSLGRMSFHFGFAPVYAAVLRVAPSKAFEFQLNSDVMYMAPTPGLYRFGSQGRISLKGLINPNGVGPFLDYTPYEIYLSFRTAPIGSLGVRAALYETGVLMSTPLAGAFGFGYGIGSLISPLIEAYCPTLNDAIGGTLDEIFRRIIDAPSAMERGAAEGAGAISFELGPISSIMQDTGGDFAVMMDWHMSSGGGGGNSC